MMRVSTASMRAAPWWGYTTVSPTLKDIWQVPLPLKAILPRRALPKKLPLRGKSRSEGYIRAYESAWRARVVRRHYPSPLTIRYLVYPEFREQFRRSPALPAPPLAPGWLILEVVACS